MKQKFGMQCCIVIMYFCFISSVRAVDIIAPSSIYETLNVDTTFDKEAFYDREILDFSFVKGKWELEFDRTTNAFKSITDLLRISTNLPAGDISSESYRLTMVKNSSFCLKKGGGIGSKNFTSVFVEVDGVEQPISELGVDIGGGALNFEQATVMGLTADHEVTVEFEPIDVGVDKKCYGVVGMHVELDI